MSDKLAFVDIETTGLDPEYCGVWEIAIITDGEEHVWTNLLSPGVTIDPWVLENTRFSTDYDKMKATRQSDTALKLIELLEGKHMVGACPWFDSQRLHRLIRTFNLEWYSRPDHPWHYHLIDIENMMVQYYLNNMGPWDSFQEEIGFPWSSRKLADMIGAPIQDPSVAHTALGDARWAKETFEWLTQ